MKTEEKQKVLYIDAKDYHLDDENVFAIHPKKLAFLFQFEKEFFDKAIIQNSLTEDLKTIGFYNICRVLKLNGTCEVNIDQPIVVMQNLESSELNAIAKLGGFSDIKIQTNEPKLMQNGKEVKVQFTKLTMIKLKKEEKTK